MRLSILKIDLAAVCDWDSFHDVFAAALGFPDFYGRNMNAWIDCMTSLDCPEDGLTTTHAPEGGVLTLVLDGYSRFAKRCPEIEKALLECSAFVNWRRIDVGDAPVLALAFHASSKK